ncbi:uncharacterized protein F4807DRAFT_431341 [Annulohypoxylon truncatum]|uniref:uncharacterized protein n=1 Tax=Annulohypoxylon truncatum TaxID=327061 RepID=UPI00200722D2|nr:uncharacterized protein F4807DRAFT_431341 [Annulohypoxylon truncatum]KAI1208439.1 hypothetical protein F4807DRAFT_431341 [Annulohypoxylon truncatum]
MFVTLRCNKDGMSVENVPATTEDGTRPRHSACNNCRLKKLKCSGDRNACSACVSSKTVCLYSTPASQAIKSRRETRKSRRRLSITRDNAPLTPAREDPQTDSEPTQEQPLSSHAMTPNTGPLLTSLPTGLDNNAGEPHLSDISQLSNSDEQLLGANWTPSSLSYVDEIINGTSDAITCDNEDYSALEQRGLPVDDDLDLNAIPSSSYLTFLGLAGASNDRSSTEVSQLSSESSTHLAPPEQALKHFDMQLPYGPSDVAATPTCICLVDVVDILEKLEVLDVEDHQASTNTIDGILSLNKNAIAKCNSMLDCSNCRLLSSHVMLVILIGRNLVLQFERLLSKLTSTESHNSHAYGSHGMYSCGQLCTEMSTSLGKYSVETSEEWKGMMHALGVIQGKSLGIFLERVRSTATYRNWMAHRCILERLEPRYHSTMRSLQSCNLTST